MKLTYFLRGLGTGIIVCAIILFAAFKTNPVKMSNQEIKKEAAKLGMVEEKEETKAQSESIDKLLSSEQKNKATTKAAATTKKVKTTQKETTTKAKATTQAPQSEYFVIGEGMYSETVSQMLCDQGFIKDAKAFNQFLNDNGYDEGISAGSYKLTKGMDYDTIAQIITNR